jgi:acyl-coenzyme A thioesterase PaaI-like protein
MSNKLSRYVGIANKLPNTLRAFALTRIFCSQVKFAGTTGIKILSISSSKVVIELANKNKVQNHIGGIHAVAAAVLAESATGIVFGMNVADSSLPLLKSMQVDYLRRMQGKLTAVAYLSEDCAAQIRQQEKGNLVIPIEITDQSGLEPITCQMEWAWISKKR